MRQEIVAIAHKQSIFVTNNVLHRMLSCYLTIWVFVDLDSSECGIGLLLETTSKTSGVFVKHVVPGGPAHLCGKIRVGDELLAINGYNIAG